jgi:hypothetical protein
MLQRMGRGSITKASWAVLRVQAKLLLFPILLVIGLGTAAGADAAIAVALTACVPYVLAAMTVFTAPGTIFRTGPYIFAPPGKAPSCMDPVPLQAAFRKQHCSP